MNTLRFLATALVYALLALSACGDDDRNTAHDGAAADARDGSTDAPGARDAQARDSGPSGGATPPACSPALDGAPVDVQLAEGMSWPVFVAGDGGAIGVSGGPAGYRLLELDRHGAIRTTTQTLWPGEIAAQTPQLALSGDVLAIVDQQGVGSSQRQQCRLALVQPSSGTALRAPTRFSDETEDESILHEAGACLVGALDDGFLLVWWQNDSATSDEAKLLAQRVGRDGTEIGERITVDAGSYKYELALATLGSRALIAHAGRGAQRSLLTVIDSDGAHDVPLTIDVHVQALQPAHDGFLALGQEKAWALDREGHVVHGPLDLPLGTSIAPFGDEYATFGTEEYLSVRAIDASLHARSEPLGVSDERDAHPEQLLALADGSWNAALFTEHGQLRFAPLRCDNAAPPPVGPASCQQQQPLVALDDGCDDEVCHVLIRLDYLTLHVRGWSAIGGPRMSVDASGAQAAASEAFAGHEYLGGEPMLSGPAAGVFRVGISPSDFGAVALVGADSGLVIMAGGVVFGGRGDYWTPAEWQPASDIACGDEAAVPDEQQLDDSASCMDGFDGSAPGSASDALQVALRTNLAAHLAEQGAFSALVLLYTPTVGSCDPSVADYVVVLTQTRE
jgi:hypothetical protein